MKRKYNIDDIEYIHDGLKRDSLFGCFGDNDIDIKLINDKDLKKLLIQAKKHCDALEKIESKLQEIVNSALDIDTDYD